MKFFPVLVILFCLLAGLVSAQEQPAASTIKLETSNGASTAKTLYGTLLLPEVKKPTVALIIAGSGSTDRNGNNPMMTNNSLKMLAEELAKQGIASVRYDKRGVGESKAAAIKEEDLRFETFIADAADWLRMLKADKRFGKVVVIGHSEGSLIGMMAARQANADAYISLAGSGESIDKLLRQQLSVLPQSAKDLAYPILDSLAAGKIVANVHPGFYALFRPSVQPYMISWMKINPQEELKKLTIPILIVQGTNDVQVAAEQANLLASANSKAQVTVIEKANHIFKESEVDRDKNLATYNNPTLSLMPMFVQKITQFIRQLK